MTPAISDLRIRATKALPSPLELEGEYPLSEAIAGSIASSRRDIAAIMAGRDNRLLVITGPCSIHDPTAALEYAQRLAAVRDKFAGELLLVMRVYFEKPRTVLGWKGLINDPGLDESYDISRGLRLARKLMVEVARLGLPIATEFLDTTLGQYYADLVSWAAIGARTVESQIHRELASGLSMPVGFKNRTDGNIQVAVDAIRSARHPHWFPSLARDGTPAVMGTTGNCDGHLVLRGGQKEPNFERKDIAAALTLLEKNQLPPFVMVDCSHGNSRKDPTRQPEVARDLAQQISDGQRGIAAVMLESHLLAGTQDYRAAPLQYGKSVTDACISWEETLPIFSLLAEAVPARRGNVVETR